MSDYDFWGAVAKAEGTEAGYSPAPKATQFTRQTIAKQDKVVADKTKVGTAEEKVGGAMAAGIEFAGKIPLLGKLVNPALTAAQFIQEKAIDPLTQNISAITLMDDVAARKDQGSFVKNWRFAREQAKKISFGQSVASGIGGVVAAIAPDVVEDRLPTFMQEEFDVFNDKQRERALKDEWAGIVVSGGLDLLLNAAGSKITGTATREGATAIVGTRTIKATEKDLAAFGQRADNAAEVLRTNGSSNDALVGMMKEIVDTREPAKLVTNPLISSSNNPNRAATILSRVNDPDTVASYLKAERGDKAALQDLIDKAPSLADTIEDQLTTPAMQGPLWSWQQVNAVPETIIGVKARSIIDDLAKRDPSFGLALDDFTASVSRGIDLNDYQPAKVAAVERMLNITDSARLAVAMGEFKPFGSGEWQNKIYQSSPFQRPVRFIQYVGAGRPQGYINVSNPRKFEAVHDMLSDLNRLPSLANDAGNALKQKYASQFIEAATDTERAVVLARLESEVLVHLAKHYGVDGLTEVKLNNKTGVDAIMDYHRQINEVDRPLLFKHLEDTNGIFVDSNGVINVTDVMLRSTQVDVVPMLDFGRLDIEVRQMIADKHRAGQYAGRLPDTVETLGGRFSYKAKRKLITVEEYLDTLNSTFSQLNLLRPGYLKNSTVDPWLRAAMDTETLFGLNEIAPALARGARNASRRIESTKVRVTKRQSLNVRRKELASYQGNMMDLKKAASKESGYHKYLRSQASELESKIKSAEKRLARLKNPKLRAEATDTLQELRDKRSQILDDADESYSKVKIYEEGAANAALAVSAKRDEIFEISEQIYGPLGAMERIGEGAFEFEIDGVKYKVDDMYNPQAKGSGPARAELDAYTNFIAAARSTAHKTRAESRATRWVTLDRNENALGYMNALAHKANRQIRTDEVGRRILEGVPADDIVKWLDTTEGRKYLSQIVIRFREKTGVDKKWLDTSDVTPDMVRDWVTSQSDLINRMYPDPEVRALILKRPVFAEELQAMFAHRQDLPQTINGPEFDEFSLTANQGAFFALSRLSDAAWRALTKPETDMVRMPLGRVYWQEAMVRRAALAKAAGHEITQELLDDIRQIAYRDAIDRVESILYSSRRMTNGAHLMRYLMAFPMAYTNSQKVALKLLAKNPYNAYWYTRVTEAAGVFGVYEDREGNTYENLKDVPEGTNVFVSMPIYGGPMPDWMRKALAPYSDERGGGAKINPKQLEFMIGDPSVAFIGSFAISELMVQTANNSIFGVYGEQISQFLRKQFGDDVYEQSILYGGYTTEGKTIGERIMNTMLPPYMKSFANFLTGGRAGGMEGDSRFASDFAATYKTAIADWQRNGAVPGQFPSVADAAKTTALFSMIRGVLQFTMPVSTTFDPITAVITRQYGEYLTQFKNSENPYAEADKRLVEQYGIDALAMVGSSKHNLSGLSSTMDDITILRKNRDLMEKIYLASGGNQKFAAMLSSKFDSADEDEYSTEVASLYQQMVYPGTMQDIIAEDDAEKIGKRSQAKMGWFQWNLVKEYRDARMAEMGITSQSASAYAASGLRAEVNQFKRELAQTYPAWAEELNQSRETFWTGTMQAVNVIVSDKKWMSSQPNDKWDEIAIWSKKANAFKKRYDLAMSADERSYEKMAFAEWHYRFMNDPDTSTEFSAFATRWLSDMPELESEDVP